MYLAFTNMERNILSSMYTCINVKWWEKCRLMKSCKINFQAEAIWFHAYNSLYGVIIVDDQNEDVEDI